MTAKNVAHRLSHRARQPKYIVRRGGFAHSVFLDKAGRWNRRGLAKKFATQGAAEKFYHKHYGGENFEIFPAS
jgi:hypothetical protein